MKKKLMICNWTLLIVGIVVMASSILLECLHGSPLLGISFSSWIWLHVISSGIMLCLVIWHVQLNWRGIRNWYGRFKRSKSKELKFTCIFSLLTMITGVIAFPHWLANGHTGIGGFHGKLGLIALAFMLWHVIKHIRWYQPKKFFG